MPGFLRILLIVAAAVVLLILLTATGIYVVGGRTLTTTMDVPGEDLELPDDSASLARGAHLAEIWGCRECHGEDLGGTLMIDGMPFARLAAPNLTAGDGGAAASFSDAEFERAIRHGIGRDGRLLMIMPSREYNRASDADVAAMVAFIRSVPSVDRTMNDRALGVIGRLVALTAEEELFPALAIDHSASHPDSITVEVSAEYGGYLANACIGCHGDDLAGRPAGPGSTIPASNLTPHTPTGLGGWTRDDFVRVFREGVRPDGTPVDSTMPWYAMSAMTDAELDAIWLYLQTLEPIDRPEGDD